MRFVVLLPLALALAACSSPPLAEASGEVQVAPERLEFGRTFIGHPAERVVTFENTGRSLQRIALEIDPPFTVEATRLELRGGEKRRVAVVFDPQEEVAVQGLLRLSDGKSVRATGEGELPPECPPSNLCRQVRFDPATGRCLEERAGDGVTCGDACFGGTCLDGDCVIGTTVDCDDGNLCTVDACDSASGCVHYDDSAACLDDADPDPCCAPICEPDKGCGCVAAENGTECRIGDCTTSFVCMEGKCSESTTPEGHECGASSPCREPGFCRAGQCIQEPPFPLEPRWSHSVAPGNTLVFDGVTDGMGQVYWAECSSPSCELVSVTGNGLTRYRKPLVSADVGRVPTGSLALAGDLLISTLAPGRIEGWSVATGQQVWSRELLPAVESAVGAGSVRQGIGAVETWVDEAAPPVIAGEVILLAVDGFAQPGDDARPWGGWVVALERATGAVRWVWSANGTFEGFIGDEGGSVYFGLRAHDVPATDGGLLVSLGTTGVERWRRPTPFQAPLATLGGHLLQATGDLRTAADGLRRHDLQLLVPFSPRRTPLIASRSLYVVGVPLEPCNAGRCPTWVTHLFRLDLETGEELWREELPSDLISQPVITSELSVLYATREAGGSPGASLLREIAADQSVVFECRLPAGGDYVGAASLNAGQWITADTASGTVMAFGVQQRAAPPAGWVTAGGTPERTARPR